MPDRRIFTSNLIMGLAIALFVYFLKESALLEYLLANGAALSLRIWFALARNRVYYAPSLIGLVGDAATIVAAAYLWTRFDTAAQRLFANGVLAIILIPVSFALYQRHGVILTSPLIVIGVMASIALGSLADEAAKLLHLKILGEKQEAEHSILGHLNHNVKPNLQIARSPVEAVHSFLEERDLLGSVLARRLDGSEETVRDALQSALVSLGRIGAILDNTKKLVTQEIRKQDFAPCRPVPLLRDEIAPRYAQRLKIRVTGDEQLALLLHRDSFVEAVDNLVRNALTHAFPPTAADAELHFAIREKRKKVVIDYTNNGRPFPPNLSARDFLSFGKKSVDSPGEGLGGAWIGKVLAAHRGTFEIVRDGQPLHFRMTLPKRGI